MKQLLIFLFFRLIFYISCCGQTKNNNYAPVNFINHIQNISADTSGVVRFECGYQPTTIGTNNQAGHANVSMIHKNGGSWWYMEAKKKFPKSVVAESRFAKYLKQDSILLKDFNKWAFFVDKKDLQGQPSTGDDFIYTDAKGDLHLPSEAEIKKLESLLDYYPKYPHTVILYEQKAGNNQWIEIDRKVFKTEEEEDKSTWRSDFLKQKLKESNENSPKK